MDDKTLKSLFKKGKLIPAILQDAVTKEVLMLAYVNAQALRLTLQTGLAHFYSRSRKTLWKKGETSGNVQRVTEIRYDCDEDTLLFMVKPAGPACHTGRPSCFFRNLRHAKPRAGSPGRGNRNRGTKSPP